MKKILSVLVFVFCCFVLASCQKNNSTKTVSNEDFEFQYNDSGLTLTKYLSGEPTAVVPKEYKGKLVTKIGPGAFKGYYDVLEIELPDTVVEIEASAFELCIGIKEIDLPDCLQTIGNAAFASCRGLKEIDIPDSVSSIGIGAFKGCKQLEEVEVDENNGYFKSDDYGVLYTKDGTELLYYPSGSEEEKYEIEDNTTTVSMFAFSGAQYLKEVTFPESMKALSDYAFYQSPIYRVSLSPNIEIIGAFCFAETKLEEVKLNEGLVNIGNSCFNWCTQIKEITIPKSVSNIGDLAFFHCSSLEKATFLCEKPDNSTMEKIFEECQGDLVIE